MINQTGDNDYGTTYLEDRMERRDERRHPRDEEHKRFASLVNEFNRAIVDRMELSEIKKRLQLILDDAEQHFAHEERLFKQWKYPDADDHANIHAQIIKEFHAVMDKFISYDLASEWIETGLKIKDILITHVLMEDMKYAKFYRKSHEVL